MIKTIEIGDKEVVLDNNIGWAIVYKDQFGQDIIQSLMPMFASALDIASGLVQQADDGKHEVTLQSLAKLANGDALLDAMVHIGTFEFTEVLNITWSLAKNADDSIPEPEKWIKQFDVFPLDEVVPEVVKLIAKGVISSKNMKRLNGMIESVRPTNNQSISTTSSSQESKED